MYGTNNGYYINGYNQQGYNPYMMQNGAMPDMLNQAKMQYQQTMPTQMQMQMQTPKTINDMIWVLNENEAVSYPVAMNNNVVLWDKSKPTIYVKSVNSQGMPSMRILDFVERTENVENTPKNHVCKCGDNFVTKQQFDELKAEFQSLTAKYDDLIEKQSAKTTKTTKKEAE